MALISRENFSDHKVEHMGIPCSIFIEDIRVNFVFFAASGILNILKFDT